MKKGGYYLKGQEKELAEMKEKDKKNEEAKKELMEKDKKNEEELINQTSKEQQLVICTKGNVNLARSRPLPPPTDRQQEILFLQVAGARNISN